MKRRILLVDDDVAVLLTLKAVLELNRFTVETATSAADAIQKLASGVYQMVITDARMENENAGFEVIRAAKRQAYNPATALLTAYPPEDGDWKRDGANSLLVKPMGTQDLLRQIEALLVLREDALREDALREDALREDALREDARREAAQQEDEKLLSQPTLNLERHSSALNREGRTKAS